MENISNKIAKGAAWMVGFKLLERGIGVVSTLVLARLLEPSDFGLVAMATAFLGLVLLLTSFSFDVALIQKQDVGRELYDTVWTFNIIFGICLTAILAASAIPLAKFYNESRLENILYVLAISTFLNGFGNIGPVAFRKDLQFHKEFYYLLAKKLMGFTVCMVLAFTLRNYWALVWGTFASKILEIILSYYVHPYRPRLCLSGRKELFGFSIWLFLNNTIIFLHNRIADFIISKLHGNHALGIYTIAYEISHLPTTELVAPINRVVLSGYSKMSKDIAVLRQGFLNVLSMIAICGVPAGIGISLVAEPMVNVLLGEKWREAVPLIQMLAVSGTINALQNNVGTVYLALGKPKLITIIAFSHTLFFFLPLLVFLLREHGVIGAAEAYLCSNILIWLINFSVVTRLISISIRSIFSVIWRPIISCIFMWAGIMYVDQLLRLYRIEIEGIRLAAEIISGAITYIFSTLLLWIASFRPNGAEHFILTKLRLFLTKSA